MSELFKLGTKLHYLGKEPGYGKIVEVWNDRDGRPGSYLVELTDGRRIGCLYGEIKESPISECYEITFELDTRSDTDEEKKDFFQKAFAGTGVPEDIKKTSIDICRSYGIEGICDPMYIANTIALGMGRGDGCGNFTPRP